MKLFHIKKTRNGQHHAQTKTDVVHACYLVLLTNTPAQAKSQPHSLEQAAECIGFYVMQIKQSSCVLNKKRPFK